MPIDNNLLFPEENEIFDLKLDFHKYFFSSSFNVNNLDDMYNKYLNFDDPFKKNLFQNITINNTNTPIIKNDFKLNQFDVLYPDKILNKENTNYNEDISLDQNILKRDRAKIRKCRFENRDNIRKKIKRGFLNNTLPKQINKILKKSECKLNFEKFSQKFVGDVSKKNNKDIVHMTLLEIIQKKELYSEKDFSNYKNNLNIVNVKENKENAVFQEMLNKTFEKLFEEYLNSNEFKVDEINRLKRKGMKKDYIKKYICLANNFVKFYSNKD